MKWPPGTRLFRSQIDWLNVKYLFLICAPFVISKPHLWTGPNEIIGSYILQKILLHTSVTNLSEQQKCHDMKNHLGLIVCTVIQKNTDSDFKCRAGMQRSPDVMVFDLGTSSHMSWLCSCPGSAVSLWMVWGPVYPVWPCAHIPLAHSVTLFVWCKHCQRTGEEVFTQRNGREGWNFPPVGATSCHLFIMSETIDENYR